MIDARGNFDGVGAGLADDAEANDLFAIEAHNGGGVFRRKGDLRHIPEAHIVADDGAGDVPFRYGGGVGTDDEFLIAGPEAARGDIEGHLLKNGDKVWNGQAEGRKPEGVENNAQGALAVPEQGHIGDPIKGNEFGDDVLFHQARQGGAVVAIRADGDANDFLRIFVGLENRQLFHGVGQLPGDPANGLSDVGRGPIKIDPGTEFNADSGIVFLRGRADIQYAGHPGDGPLDQARDFRIHGFRRRAGEFDANAYDGAVDVRKLPDLHGEQSGQAGDDHQEIEDHDEPGPSNPQGGQVIDGIAHGLSPRCAGRPGHLGPGPRGSAASRRRPGAWLAPLRSQSARRLSEVHQRGCVPLGAG